ncbi:biotin--[acetyl-CoA-carboxylase] ligase [Alteribacillus iranensis]|uniref:Bifunctional ligase/repressor BirA n=1 Tax=Alteribacillus iranensis TaxID=930128 RepID=A0A1I1ZRW5_9BACI|nr:biotin--[acetyl-CoA-carboxylase] ligase [Alteribacillus iranensis]SFE34484.1 BirA family transcriptional regulator, biotin operon repressor / biotin-[acetyl-CoA-carboxylase] ligase [Alteribacillus iranensis]
MRSKLLQLLRQTNGYISGQEISKQLGISRTAVWKHMEELRKNGYELEAVPRKGYRLLNDPNRAGEDEIKAKLQTQTLGQEIIYKNEVTSTQEEAHEAARKGAAEGTIIVADRQLKGKGRLGRKWESPPGSGLWFSLILRPPIPPQEAPQLTLLTAVAVTEAVTEATGLQPQIKWPNDILLNGKKVAGILTEMQSDPDRIQAVIVGIGININQMEFPEELSDIATSLKQESEGTTYSRADFIAILLSRYEYWYHHYLKHGFLDVKKRWEALTFTIGKKIKATTVTKTLIGTAVGITDDGVLLLKKEDGEIEHIYSADISL